MLCKLLQCLVNFSFRMKQLQILVVLIASGSVICQTLYPQKLPNNTRPIHYDLSLRTNVHNGDVAYSGNVKIEIEILEETEEITFHMIDGYSDELQFDFPTLYNMNNEEIPTWFVVIYPYKEMFELTTQEPLQPGDHVLIDIDFSGRLYQWIISHFLCE